MKWFWLVTLGLVGVLVVLKPVLLLLLLYLAWKLVPIAFVAGAVWALCWMMERDGLL